MEIFWTFTARNDLKQIYSYIAQDSMEYVTLLIETIYDKVKTLLNYNRLGRIVPEMDLDEFREIIYRNYRIIYNLSENAIKIITILHTSQQFKMDR
ncbi:MAG: type II toxin-antitoxin system RelE/ParE family toxin [Promethearchaeota archaeon]